MRTLLSAALLVLTTLGVAAWATEQPAATGEANPDARTVLVTGANRGLGLEFAKQYSAAGWRVIGTARTPAEATELQATGVMVVQLDVTDASSVEAMVKTLDGRPIDLLINNAGIGGRLPSVEDLDVERAARVLDVNLLGPMRVTTALLPHLRKGNGKTIVSISSGLGSITNNTGARYYGYRESKAGLNMFMRSLAAELGPEGFICIAMSPGWVQTDMGGSGAPLTPEQSIGGMREVIGGLTAEKSGRFWSHNGSEIPW